MGNTVPVNVNNLVEVTLADGVTRHLRYSLGAKKRLCERFGQEPAKMLSSPPEELLPMALMEGLVEKDGISEEDIMERLVTSQMIDEITLKFIDSFFVPTAAQNLRRVLAAVKQNSEKVLQALENKSTQPLAETAPATVQ